MVMLYSQEKEKKSLLSEVLEVERNDKASRKIHPSVTPWIEAIDRNNTGYNAVQVFNWLADVVVNQGVALVPGKQVSHYTKFLERFGFYFRVAYGREIAVKLADTTHDGFLEAQSSRPRDVVPWAYLTYSEAAERGMLPAIREHLRGMEPEKAREYLKFIKSVKFFPKAFNGEEGLDGGW